MHSTSMKLLCAVHCTAEADRIGSCGVFFVVINDSVQAFNIAESGRILFLCGVTRGEPESTDNRFVRILELCLIAIFTPVVALFQLLTCIRKIIQIHPSKPNKNERWTGWQTTNKYRPRTTEHENVKIAENLSTIYVTINLFETGGELTKRKSRITDLCTRNWTAKPELTTNVKHVRCAEMPDDSELIRVLLSEDLLLCRALLAARRCPAICYFR